MTLKKHISQLHILANWNIIISLHSRMNVCLLSHAKKSKNITPVMRVSTQNSWQVLKVDLIWFTLPETNSSPLKIGHPKRKVVFQPSIFRCYVSFREGNLMESELNWWNPFEDGSPNFLRRHTLNLWKNICLMIMRKLRIMWDSRIQKKKKTFMLPDPKKVLIWLSSLPLLSTKGLSHLLETSSPNTEQRNARRLRIARMHHPKCFNSPHGVVVTTSDLFRTTNMLRLMRMTHMMYIYITVTK